MEQQETLWRTFISYVVHFAITLFLSSIELQPESSHVMDMNVMSALQTSETAVKQHHQVFLSFISCSCSFFITENFHLNYYTALCFNAHISANSSIVLINLIALILI